MSEICVNYYPEIFPAVNLAGADIVEGAAGPGPRLVFWTQGCAKRCPGCINGPFLPATRARVTTVAEMIAVIPAYGIDGVTLSGGEPVLQAAALVPLLREVRDRGLTVVCYTGYRVEELHACQVAGEFLSLIDLLIDGEYHQELPRAGVYQPSANQRLHFLSGRIAPREFSGCPETVIRIAGDHASATGTLPLALRTRLFQELRAVGVNISAAPHS